MQPTTVWSTSAPRSVWLTRALLVANDNVFRNARVGSNLQVHSTTRRCNIAEAGGNVFRRSAIWMLFPWYMNQLQIIQKLPNPNSFSRSYAIKHVYEISRILKYT